MRRRLLALVPAVIVAASCGRPEPPPRELTAHDLEPLTQVFEMAGRSFAQTLLTRTTVGGAATYFYRIHGRWPASVDELAGIPQADGSPFDPAEHPGVVLRPGAGGTLDVGTGTDDCRRWDALAPPRPTTAPTTGPTARPATAPAGVPTP